MSRKASQPQLKSIRKTGLIHSIHDEHLIFLVEAISVNKLIREDINELFEEKRKTFSKYARNSSLFNHPLIISGSVQHEELCRKVLGVLLHTRDSDNKRQVEILNEIIYKGWPRAASNIINHKNVNIEAYINTLKYDTNRNYTENFTELFIFYMICINCNVPIINPTWVASYFTSLSLRAFVYSNEMYFDLFNKKDETAKTELIAFKDDLLRKYGIQISSDNQIRIENIELLKYFKSLYRLAYSDKIDLYCLFRDIELGEKDLNDILCSFSLTAIKNSHSNDESAQQFISAIVIKLLIKSIQYIKEQYCERIKESEKIVRNTSSLNRLDNENKRLISENRLRSKRIDELSEKLRLSKSEAEKPLLEKIRELEKQVAKQKELIIHEKEKEKELAALREFFFSLENQDDASYAGSATEPVMDLKDTAAAIVGGNAKWSVRMKELLPNWVFITSTGFDKRSLDNIQSIFFVPNSMSHSLYYKAVAIARNKNMDIGFIYSQNEQLALKEIAKALARAGY